jgi:hypothetical protein
MMNERILELAEQAGASVSTIGGIFINKTNLDIEKFAELIVKKVLDEVTERAWVSGDRVWSDELDRPWIELEFGLGKLAELKNERTNSRTR